MNIFDMLRADHVSIRQTLDDLIEPRRGHDWVDAFYDLKIAMVAHDRAEEQVVYDRLRAIPHRGELADAKTDEHEQIESILHALEALDPKDASWGQMIALFKNEWESHIAEEETSVLPILEEVVDDIECDSLAREFERLRDEIIESLRVAHKGIPNVNPAGLSLERT